MNPETREEEEDGWLLLNHSNSHGPTPLHSPPQSPSHRASFLPLFATTSDLSSEWSPPSWATNPRSNVSNSGKAVDQSFTVDTSSWSPPAWAPKLSPSPQQKSKAARNSLKYSMVEMGERKAEWEWEAPVWAKGEAKGGEKDDATKVSLFFLIHSCSFTPSRSHITSIFPSVHLSIEAQKSNPPLRALYLSLLSTRLDSLRTLTSHPPSASPTSSPVHPLTTNPPSPPAQSNSSRNGNLPPGLLPLLLRRLRSNLTFPRRRWKSRRKSVNGSLLLG